MLALVKFLKKLWVGFTPCSAQSGVHTRLVFTGSIRASRRISSAEDAARVVPAITEECGTLLVGRGRVLHDIDPIWNFRSLAFRNTWTWKTLNTAGSYSSAYRFSQEFILPIWRNSQPCGTGRSRSALHGRPTYCPMRGGEGGIRNISGC